MAGNKKKDRALSFFAIICAVLCVGGIISGYWLSASSELYYSLEKSNRVEVRSAAELMEMGDAAYNNEIVLMDDIYITDSSFSLGTQKWPFCGIFNGNGHNVYCQFDAVEEGESLFYCIDDEGIVQNTNFIFNNVTVNGGTYGAIAGMNYGTIKNCTVTFSNFRISHKDGYYSAAVAINNGTVSNLTVSCSYSLGSVADEKKIVLGNVCAYNYGTVKNCVSAPQFYSFECTEEYNILTSNAVNRAVGAICSFTQRGGTTSDCAMLIDRGVYTSDKSAGYIVAYERSEIFNAKVIFDQLDFDNRLWRLDAAQASLSLNVAG